MRAKILSGLLFILTGFATLSEAVELVMVEQPGCVYCRRWNAALGPIYPKTEIGEFAPLRHIQLADQDTSGINFKSKVIFTPTFVLVDEGQELGRLEGYASEDFFWGLLEMLLKDKTEFEGSTK